MPLNTIEEKHCLKMKYIFLTLMVFCVCQMCFAQTSIPATIKTDHVQCSIGDVNGGDLKMPPIELCNFFYLCELKNNVLKYSDCNTLQDVEEIVIVSSNDAVGTQSSWSKNYLGYNRKHPQFLSNGSQLFDIHITLIFRNYKYAVFIETTDRDKITGQGNPSIANMYYSL